MWLKTGLILVLVLGVFLGYVALKPSDYVITRELPIHAPAEKIFPYLNNTRLFNEWNPWLAVDPATQMSFSGPDAGVGSKASWKSTGQMGEGAATVTESVPNQMVRERIEYQKPFTMSQDAEFTIRPAGAEQVVVWKVSGQNNFMGRLMCTFMNMDKMVGGTFEKGLATLKSKLEKS